LRDCAALRCAAEDPDLHALRTDIQRLGAVRKDADAALRQPLAERPPGLVAKWDAAITETVTTLDHFSTTLTERVRLVDAT
jgi:hypothetical protein